MSLALSAKCCSLKLAAALLSFNILDLSESSLGIVLATLGGGASHSQQKSLPSFDWLSVSASVVGGTAAASLVPIKRLVAGALHQGVAFG